MAQHGNNLTRMIYKHSPWFVQTLMASYYGFLKSFKKYGKHYREYYNRLNRSQWFSSDELADLQIKELKRVISHAVNTVPFYAELFKKLNLSADDIQCTEDLRKLPVLTKEDVRRNYARLRSNVYRSTDMLTSSTSGSTGKSLELAISKECYQKQHALIWLHRSWAGVKYGDKTATCSGHRLLNMDRTRPPFWVNNLYEKQILFSSYHLSPDSLKYYVKKLMKFQPKLIWGYPSSLHLIASFIVKENMTEIRPKAIFTSSETLFDHQRETIEKAFNAKVYNYYSNGENVANIVECEKGGLHIQQEYSIIEFLDHKDDPVEYGQEGRMICTGLTNDAMPLIRYDIGDVAIPIDGECSCGRKSPLVAKIIGRADDLVVTPEGRLLVRIGGLHKIKTIKEAQIIQEDMNTLLLKIVRSPEYSDKDTLKIISMIQDRIGPEMKIEYEFVNHIPRGPSGKFKYMVSKVPFSRERFQ